MSHSPRRATVQPLVIDDFPSSNNHVAQRRHSSVQRKLSKLAPRSQVEIAGEALQNESEPSNIPSPRASPRGAIGASTAWVEKLRDRHHRRPDMRMPPVLRDPTSGARLMHFLPSTTTVTKELVATYQNEHEHVDLRSGGSKIGEAQPPADSKAASPHRQLDNLIAMEPSMAVTRSNVGNNLPSLSPAREAREDSQSVKPATGSNYVGPFRPVITPQMDWWEGPRPEAINTSRHACDICGQAYEDVSENVFLAKEHVMSVSDHVDHAIRVSGLVLQKGYVQKWAFPWIRLEQPVVFDEGQMKWVDLSDRSTVRKRLKDIKKREDVVPTGIISVVGNLDFSEMTASLRNNHTASQKKKAGKSGPRAVVGVAEAMGQSLSKAGSGDMSSSMASPLVASSDFNASKRFEKSVRHGRTASGDVAPPVAEGQNPPQDSTSKHVNEPRGELDGVTLHSGYDVDEVVDTDDDDEQMIMVIGDPDADFLDKKEVIKFIKHYLTRSVVKAARTAGASIVTSSNDDIARQLALGYQAFIDPVGVKPVKSTPQTHLVGVFPECDRDFTQLGFSHSIFLRSDGGHRFEVNRSNAVPPAGEASNMSGGGPVVVQNRKIVACVHCGTQYKGIASEDDAYCREHPNYVRLYQPRIEAAVAAAGNVTDVNPAVGSGFELPASAQLTSAPLVQLPPNVTVRRPAVSENGRPKGLVNIVKRFRDSLDFVCDVTKPLPSEVRSFKHRMLESLNQGYQQRPIEDMIQPPNRVPAPVVVILFGGDENSRDELHAAVSRGWPILIVEGSGGYADILSSTISNVNRLSPDASQDDYRSLLSGVDVITSEVIVNGKWHLIRKGTEVSQVERLIQTALKGDEILHQAWRLYNVWSFNAKEWTYHHQVNQLAILMLGLLTTLASVAQTFLILLYRDRATSSDFISRWGSNDVLKAEKYWYLSFRLLQWLVIGLPITLTLLHAIFQRMNPWAKLSAFRSASTLLLREIYSYRSKTLGYSSEAVRKGRESKGVNVLSGGESSTLATATSGANAALRLISDIQAKEAAVAANSKKKSTAAQHASMNEADNRSQQAKSVESTVPGVMMPMSYASREELLGQMIRQIQQQLGRTEAGQVLLLEPLDHSVPPSHIASTGDTGFSDLTPDDYVNFRLKASRVEYERRHSQLEAQSNLLMILIISASALGTALAAVSAYGLGYLQAWVAFATVVTNSLTRFMDFTRMSAMSELCNAAEHRLLNVERWWSSLGTDADSDKNRTKLVSDTERVIQEELTGWSKQLQGESEERRSDDGSKEGTRLQEIEAAQTARQEMGLGLLEKSAISRGLMDPNGPLSAELKREILDLSSKLGGVIRETAISDGSAISSLEDKLAADAAQGVNLPTAASTVNRSGKGRASERLLSAASLTQDSKVRQRFLSLFRQPSVNALLDHGGLTPFALHSALQFVIPTYHDVVAKFQNSTTLIDLGAFAIETAKIAILEEFAHDFRESLREMPSIDTTVRLEDFVSEMYHVTLVCGSQLRYASKESLAQLLDSTEVKEAVLLLSKKVFEKLIQTCLTCFDHEIRPKDSAQPSLMQLLKGVLLCEVGEIFGPGARRASLIHVKTLGDGESDALTEETLMSCIPRLVDATRAIAIPLEIHTKEDVLNLLPRPLRQCWERLWSGQKLIEMVRMASSGTAASRVVGSTKSLLDMICGPVSSGGGGGSSALTSLLHDPNFIEAFVAGNESLTQISINRSSKNSLIRSLEVAQGMSKAFSDQLSSSVDELSLKSALSVLQARQSNTFVSTVVQKLADSFFLVDFKDILNGDEMEHFVNRVALRGTIQGLEELLVEEVLTMIIPAGQLRKQLSGLNADQLRALLHTMHHILNPSFYVVIWRKVTASWVHKRGSTVSPVRRKILDVMHPYAIQRFVFRVLYLSQREADSLGDCETLSELLWRLGDAVVSACLYGIFDDPRHEMKFVEELADVALDIIDEVRRDSNSMDAAHEQSMIHDPVVLRVVHQLISTQPDHRKPYARLFFRMSDDQLTISRNSLKRLIEARADHIDVAENDCAYEILRCFGFLAPTRSREEAEALAAFGVRSVDELRDVLGHDPDRQKDLKEMLVEMDILLDMELPYMAFEHIAQWCVQFDLRDIVTSLLDRHAFMIAWVRFCSIESRLKALSDVAEIPLLYNDTQLCVSFDVHAAKRFQTQLLKQLETWDCPEGELLSRVIRNIAEIHTVQLCTHVRTFIYQSAGGSVLHHYCDTLSQRIATSGSSPLSQRVTTVLSLEQIALYCLSIARGNVEEMKAAFAKWDANQFEVGHQSENIVDRLRANIPNDEVVDRILELQPNDLEWLFLMMRTILAAEHRAFVASGQLCQQQKKRFEAISVPSKDQVATTTSQQQRAFPAVTTSHEHVDVFARVLESEDPLYD